MSPTDAIANSDQSTASPLNTASNPASAAATSVIGSTPARVRNNQRDTGSISPSGGLVVARTQSQRLQSDFEEAPSSDPAFVDSAMCGYFFGGSGISADVRRR